MATQDQKSNIISQGRQIAANAIFAFGNVERFLSSYNAGDYITLTDADFIGANEGIKAADFAAWALALKAISGTWSTGQDKDAEKVTV